jgi:broad specificity phosphatase PhoE
MLKPTRLYLVRHGQTDLNRDRRFRGMSDVPLNDAGRAEALGAARILAGSGVTRIFTSPIRRSVETAHIIERETGARVAEYPRLTDIDYGGWQGLTVEEVIDRFGREAIESWRRDPGSFRFPGGDSMREVRERVGPALESLVQESPGDAIAAVTHMAVLKVCFLALMELPFDWFWKVGIDNGSVSMFTHGPESGFVLEQWNRPALPCG